MVCPTQIGGVHRALMKRDLPLGYLANLNNPITKDKSTGAKNQVKQITLRASKALRPPKEESPVIRNGTVNQPIPFIPPEQSGTRLIIW
ncbi:hypothetical protein AVEN_248658-1 [Araneus ventricosus]|uniref:Uncharacterized protein n=1 Tax=Araneus ventricosus TaxID=182803 RepID=A0A4Y2C0U7_ARAVE|nr:hypothetical protein AVEN_248658-1 [Araneus ventricosus]